MQLLFGLYFREIFQNYSRILIMNFFEYYWAHKQVGNTVNEIRRKYLKGKNMIISKNVSLLEFWLFSASF